MVISGEKNLLHEGEQKLFDQNVEDSDFITLNG